MKLSSKVMAIGFIILALGIANGQDEVKAPEPEVFDFANGQYMMVKENGLVVFPDKPMLKERLGQYGNITVNPKTREKIFNIQDKGKVTEKGMQVHDLLSRMVDKDGFFAFQVVILEYDKVSIVKYQRSSWNDHMDKILKVFE